MFRFYKSIEGIEEYKKAGQAYPEHINDMLFEHHKQLIAWDINKKERINSITRIKRSDGSEYLVYSETSEGHDKIYGRRHTFFRDNLGKYLEIEKEVTRIPNQEIIENPNSATDFEFSDDGTTGKPANKKEMFKEVVNILGERVAYSIPYTKANLNKLHEKCIDKGLRQDQITRYGVSKENGITIIVTGGYEQFLNGDFDTLYSYGCIPTKAEKERIDNMGTRGRGGDRLPAAATAAASPLMMEAIA